MCLKMLKTICLTIHTLIYKERRTFYALNNIMIPNLNSLKASTRKKSFFFPEMIILLGFA